jgi:hypothetical protein
MKKNRIPKIVILLPCWGRSKVTRMVLANITNVITQVKDKVDISVLCIISPEDPQRSALLKITSAEKKFHVVFFENYPLGRKHNAGINYALEQLTFDYLMNLGSDDLVHPMLIDFYMPHIKNKEPFFGINNLYFIQNRSKKTILYRTYNDHRAIGAGRMIHVSVLQEMKKQYVNLYHDEFCRGLDCSSSNRIKEEVQVNELVLDAGSFPFIVDIKTETNINDFSIFEQYNKRVQVVSRDYLKSFFPNL